MSIRLPDANNLFPNPFQQGGGVQNLQMEMTVNGAKISRKQTADEFSGSYAKDELKILVKGRMENDFTTLLTVTTVVAAAMCADGIPVSAKITWYCTL